MNYKQIIEQAEAQHKAHTKVKETVMEQKIKILKDFFDPIFEYLLYIQNSPDFKFSAEPHFNKDRDTTNPLFTVWKASLDKEEREPSTIKYAKENILKGLVSDMLSTELGYATGSVKIYFAITDDFIPSIYYEFRKARFQFFTQEDFAKSFTEFLIQYRK